ncbi:MAG: EamA family transporter [Candidatus Latescibacteria bacterium]|nr:EamA family transporter [Candidatus Latescibacterota bacterium]
MSDRIERRSLGLTLAFTTLLLWGALPVVLKLLLQSLDPFTVTWYRFLLAGAMLIPVVHFRYGLASPFRIRGAVSVLAVVCVLGLGGNYLTYPWLGSDRNAVFANNCALGRADILQRSL